MQHLLGSEPLAVQWPDAIRFWRRGVAESVRGPQHNPARRVYTPGGSHYGVPGSWRSPLRRGGRHGSLAHRLRGPHGGWRGRSHHCRGRAHEPGFRDAGGGQQGARVSHRPARLSGVSRWLATCFGPRRRQRPRGGLPPRRGALPRYGAHRGTVVPHLGLPRPPDARGDVAAVSRSPLANRGRLRLGFSCAPTASVGAVVRTVRLGPIGASTAATLAPRAASGANATRCDAFGCLGRQRAPAAARGAQRLRQRGVPEATRLRKRESCRAFGVAPPGAQAGRNAG
mmetsp:Transcript_92548/g.261435  ORF Transcript_92548/g.261435 Transcript_92548/m.261435 type:complete len:284 (+) Transcript_92548:727-1578(+)